MASPYGYWTFGGKNGLAGLDGTEEILPDGRVVFHPDPDNPAVLHAEFIVNALLTSRIARKQFDILFPRLLAEEQARLLGILEVRPFVMQQLTNPKDYYDRIQSKEMQGSVRLSRGSTTGSRATSSSTTGALSVGSFTPDTEGS